MGELPLDMAFCVPAEDGVGMYQELVEAIDHLGL